MKKFTSTILTVLLIISCTLLSSCGRVSDDGQNSVSEQSGASVDVSGESGKTGDEQSDAVSDMVDESIDVLSRVIDDYNGIPHCDCVYPKLEGEPEDVPPGTLPSVERIPEADQTIVGKSVTSVLSSYCVNSELTLAYYPDLERLVIIDNHSCQVSRLSVYEASLGDAANFYNTVTDGDFDAKLILNMYITFEESMYTRYIDKADTNVVLHDAADAEGADKIFALVSLENGERVTVVYTCSDDGPLERVYERYNERFGLKNAVYN